MSTLVMSQCWPLQMPPTPKAVLISLADNANDHGECWPSISTICQRTCFGERAVQAAIRWLEQRSALRIDHSNGGRTNRYFVTPTAYQNPAENAGSEATDAAADAPSNPAPDAPPQQMHPASPAGNPAPDAPLPRSKCGDTPQQMHPNRKEPSRTVSKATVSKRASAPPLPVPDGVDPQTWIDWLALRRAKKAPVTETVLRQARAEAAKAGMSLTRFLEVWCARGSQGLQADWLKPNERAGQPATARAGPSSAPSKRMQGLMALEGLKSGNRVDSGRDRDRPAEAVSALPGPRAVR